MHILFIFILLISISGCQKKRIYPYQSFSLEFNQKAKLKFWNNNAELQFVKLLEDSRCPPDSQCVTFGGVAVQLSVDGELVNIGLNHQYASFAELNGLNIELYDVYYRNKDYGIESSYIVRMMVY